MWRALEHTLECVKHKVWRRLPPPLAAQREIYNSQKVVGNRIPLYSCAVPSETTTRHSKYLHCSYSWYLTRPRFGFIYRFIISRQSEWDGDILFAAQWIWDLKKSHSNNREKRPYCIYIYSCLLCKILVFVNRFSLLPATPIAAQTNNVSVRV